MSGLHRPHALPITLLTVLAFARLGDPPPVHVTHTLAFQRSAPNAWRTWATNYAATVEPGGLTIPVGRQSFRIEVAGARADSPSTLTREGDVRFSHVQPGVDVLYYGNSTSDLEFDFLLDSGADPSQIAMRWHGAAESPVSADGSVTISAGGVEVRLMPPSAWQVWQGRRIEVAAAYRRSGDEIGFELGPYDSTLPLRIDPTILVQLPMTPLRPAAPNPPLSFDSLPLNVQEMAAGRSARAVAFDPAGNLYLAGSNHAWVSKLDPSGETELFRTYLGGDVRDTVTALALDTAGKVHVGGSIRAKGAEQGFVATLNAAGERTSWTLLSAPVTALALASDGGVYRASGNSVTLEGGATLVAPGAVAALATDAGGIYAAGEKYLARWSTGSANWDWVMPLGGSGKSDEALALSVSNGVVYLAGTTDSLDFPVKGAYQSRLSGVKDAFVTAVSAVSRQVLWSTYFGGHGTTSAAALTIDSSGNLLVAGSTDASDLPATEKPSAPQNGFLARFDPTGRLLDDAYTETANDARLFAVASAPDGTPFVAGTYSSGYNDVLVAKMKPRIGGQTASTTSLSPSPSPATYGQWVTLTATVSPSAATGKVTFYDGTNVLGDAAVSSGAATLKTIALGFGPRSLHAYYGGDATYHSSSSSSVSITVNANASSALVPATGSPYFVQYGEAIAQGDFNHDGKMDLVAGGAGGEMIVWLGNGDGTFSMGPNSPIALNPFVATELVAGDFNNDGNLDVAMLWQGTNISIWLGDGNGNLAIASGSPFTVGTVPLSIAAADFNVDGRLDLIVGDNAGNITVLLGTGNGGFTAQPPYAMGNAVPAIAVGDFDNNGVPDIVVPALGYNAAVLLGNGSGGFTQSATPAAQYEPGSVVTADFNLDGNLDFAIASQYANTVDVYLGNGHGAFTAATATPPTFSGAPTFLSVGDFNGDGKPDLAVVNADFLTIVLGRGDGNFGTPGSTYSTGLGQLAIGDFNGDGRMDVAVANYQSNGMVVLLGNGTSAPVNLFTTPNPSTFGQPVAIAATVTPSAATGRITYYDGVTVLGDAPLTSGNSGLQTISLPPGTHSLHAYYPGDGTHAASTSPAYTQTVKASPASTFNAETPIASGADSIFVTTGDFNNDGLADLAVANDISGNGTVTILLGNGSGGFSPGGNSPVAVGSLPQAIAVADYNNDGTLDLAVANSGSDTVTILVGNGQGQFDTSSPINLPAGTTPQGIAAADFNGDGHPDLAITGFAGNTLKIYLSNGGGGFALHQTVSFGANSTLHTVVAGDFNHDGKADVAVVGNGFVSVLLGDGTGNVAAAPGSPHTVAGNPTAIAAGDFSGDGVPDLAVLLAGTGSVEILVSAGNGSFNASPAIVAVGASPNGIVAADLNGDGYVDVAVTLAGGVVEVSHGNGSGGISAPTPFNVGTNPMGLAVSEFNGDGRPDLAVANYGAVNVTVLLGGLLTTTTNMSASPDPGVFGQQTTLTAVVSPTASTGRVTFFTGTLPVGEAPLVSGTAVLKTTTLPAGTQTLRAYYGGDNTYGPSSSPTASLLVNTNPSSGFNSAPVLNPQGSYAIAVASADFNNDGKADLALLLSNNSHNLQIYLGDGLGGFTTAPGSPLYTGHYAAQVVTADFNGDGKIDLVFPNTDNSVTVLLGNGDGSFTQAAGSPIPVGTEASWIALGDFNGDGRPDLAVTCFLSSNVAILLGNGDGTFTPAPGSPVAVTGLPEGIVAADFNGDGFVDLAVNATGVTVLLGNGKGGFTAPPIGSISVSGTPIAMITGDFNSDGKPDLAVMLEDDSSNSIGIYLGNGNATFTTAVPITTAAFGYLATGDFNGDGKVDLAVTLEDNNTAQVYLGNGLGAFAAAPGNPLNAGSTPNGLAVADFNGDGRQDVAIANYVSPGAVTILLGTGPTVVLTAAPQPSEFGKHTILTATLTPNTSSGIVTFYDGTTIVGDAVAPAGTATLNTVLLPAGAGSLRAYYSNGNSYGDSSPSVSQTVQAFAASAFSQAPSSPLSPGASSNGIAIADFDGDGVADIAVACFGKGVMVYTGNANGTFTSVATNPVYTSSDAFSLATGDFNNDGYADLVVTLQTEGKAAVLLGNGHGAFPAAGVSPWATGTAPFHVVVADFNRDGYADFATANAGSGTVTVWLGSSTGFFNPPGNPFSVGASTGALAVGDFNGDGNPDLAVANQGGNNVSILLGNGGGNFTQPPGSPFSAGTAPTAVAVADFDGDGFADLAFAGSTGITLLLGNGDGAFAASPNSPLSVAVTPTYLVVSDFNGDGKPDLAAATYNGTSSKIFVLPNDGHGNFTQLVSGPVTVAAHPAFLAVGEFNGDGRPDFVVPSFNTGAVAILLGGAGACAVTGDSSTGVADVQSMINQAAGKSAPVNDLNGDKKVSVVDVEIVLHAALGLACLGN